MANADVRKDAKPVSFTVLNVVLDSGERLPCLVDSATWIPVRVAMRWAVRYRRYRVQASTLANNLRVLARVYLWAREHAGYDLDNHLTQGQTLRNRSSPLYARSASRSMVTLWIPEHSTRTSPLLKIS